MTILTIAWKDLRQFARNVPALAMSLAAPLILTALFGFAFGGLGGHKTPQIQPTTIQVVNLDAGGQQGLNLGKDLVTALQTGEAAKLVKVSLVESEAAARTAIEQRKAEAAIVIPRDLTAATLGSAPSAEVLLYHDPTLSTKPAILRGLVQQILDSYGGATIAAQIAADRAGAQGATAEQVNGVASQAAQAYMHSAESSALLTVRTVSTAAAPVSAMAAIMDKINVGMMIFFMFYGAATTAMSILHEDEERTLWRLFTTPTPRATVLAGKFVSVFVVTLAQTVVLILASRLLFAAQWAMHWGAILLVIAGCMAAAGLGLFLMSLLRSTRQAGIVLGGVLTVLGMAGGLFTSGFQNLPKAFDTVRLFTPHGWAMRGWEALIRGDGIGATLMPVAACAAFGLIFFAAGARIFRRRYA